MHFMKGEMNMQFSNSQTLRRRGLSALRGNWQTALMVTFAAGLIGLLQNALQFRLSADTLGSMRSAREAVYAQIASSPYASLIPLLVILQFILGSALLVGLNLYFVALHTEKNPPFSLVFSRLRILWRCLGLYLMMGIFIFLWSLLLVVPGIIAAYRYAMAPYLLAENPEMGVMEAISRSKEMMDGHKARLFFLQFSFLGWIILALAVTGGLTYLGLVGTVLGMLASLTLQVYMNSAVAGFYVELSGMSADRAQGRVE